MNPLTALTVVKLDAIVSSHQVVINSSIGYDKYMKLNYIQKIINI